MPQGDQPFRGKRPVTGTFEEIPIVSGAGEIRIEFFIRALIAGPFLKGDGREFDIAPNDDSSRVIILIDFESGSGSFRINPSCFAGGVFCADAYALGLGNDISVTVNGNTVTIIGKATNSALPVASPSIDFEVRIEGNPELKDVIISGEGDAYPSLEITRTAGGVTQIRVRSPETKSLCLFDITGKIPIQEVSAP